MWLVDHLVGREGDMVMCTIWRPHVVRIKVTHGVHMLTKDFTITLTRVIVKRT